MTATVARNMFERIHPVSTANPPIIALLILVASTSLYAGMARGQMFFESKLGRMKVDVPATKNPINLTLSVGYEIDSKLADLSIVGEVNRSIVKGEMPDSRDIEFQSNGLYLRWKSIRSLFVTLRGGIVENVIRVGASRRTSNGIALGGGIGVVMGRTRLHLEYLSLAGDANFLSLGLEF